MLSGPRFLLESRRWRFILLTILGSSLLGLLCAELVVRLLFRYNTPDTLRQNSVQYLPSVLASHILKPDQQIEVDKAWGLKRGTPSSHRTVVINEHGFRGHPFPLAKPPDSLRVVILGGSAVFDQYATEGEDWPHRVEANLQSSGFPSVEVINGGVPGYASFDSLGRLFAQVWMLEPDYVLLYNAWNDIKYFRSLAPDRPLLALIHPHDPEADPLQSYRGPLDRLLSHSQFYVKLRTRYFLSALEVGAEGATAPGRALDTYAAYGPKQYELDLNLFVDASRHVGAVPVLMTQASLVTPDAPEADRRRIAYDYQRLTHEALVRAMTECNEIVRKVGRERGVEVFDLASKLSGRSELFEDHVHTSALGSEALGGAVAELLVPLLKKNESHRAER